PKRIVFAEADHLDVLKAAQIVHDEKIGIPILLGRRETFKELMDEIEFDADVQIIDPKSDEEKEHLKAYAKVLWKKRRRKGITLYDAEKLMRERNYYAAMMVSEGDADAMLSGYSRAYPTVVKPILEIIGLAKGATRIATTNLMNTSRGPLFISDTSLNIDPDAKNLARIARMTAFTVKLFGMQPVIAMVSYSNFGSSSAGQAEKVQQAVEYLHRAHPDILVDGGVQVDFALNKQMMQSKFPFTKLAGMKVNTLIYPNLDSANGTYKLIKELYHTESIGPIIMGLDKPAHILQLGASVEEMVNMAAVSIVDAQEKLKWKQSKK
ncbi:MAG TPA: phosphate acyltransferase, partial [Flavobacteriaceae bacterium]|nr:phosphate acyltransferase [Flavobacteriaceae bacterium]